LQTASLLLLSRATGVNHTVFVWLPTTQQIGLVQSQNLVEKLDSFCSTPLSPTIDQIKTQRKEYLFLLRKYEVQLEIESLKVTWNIVEFPKALYPLIQNPSWECESYNIHYSRVLGTMEYTRLHEISEKLGIDGVVNLINLQAPFPGKRDHLLFAGYFVPYAMDPACVEFVTIKSRILLRFKDAAIVSRLLYRHGKEDKKKIFRIEKKDGQWLLKGLHPLVPTLDPNPRPFSINHSRLEEERSPSEKSVLETLALIPDAIEVLHKASPASSTLISSGPKGEIGKCSIKISLPFDTNSNQQKSFTKEMKSNALTMDRARYLLQCSLLFEHVLSRVHIALLSHGNSNNLHVETRFKKDKSFEVRALSLIFHTLVHIV
jgi:hypothetical protein